MPIGNSALIRGIASAGKHLRPGLRIIGVQAEGAPAYYLSWRSGVPVTTDMCDTIADGLATRAPVPENVQALRELVDDVRLVSDEQMLNAIRHLWVKEQIKVEPAGAASTAAWLGNFSCEVEQPEVLLVTGANVLEPVFRQALKTKREFFLKKPLTIYYTRGSSVSE